MKNYKEIYINQVLPKKTTKKNTIYTYIDSLKVLEEFSIYRLRANKEVL